jgi:hypothetical protein
MTFKSSIAEALRRALRSSDGYSAAHGTAARASEASPRTPVLLEWRLTALRLDPGEIERLSPDVPANLRSTCTLCTEKQRCLDDMMEFINPPGWESYCPNSGTIRTLL